MKLLARSFVYWSGIDKDVDAYVRNCDNCQKAAKLPVKVPLTPWPIMQKPMERVHCDFAGPIHGKMFLVVVDAYSRWPEIFALRQASSENTIAKLRNMFARYGNPTTLVSDNGTQFTSATFKMFCERNGIQHLRSPAFHPQSNGLAERFVDIFKRGMSKIAENEWSDATLDEFLMSYRTTPCPSNNNEVSPAKAFLGRDVNTPLSLLGRTKALNTRNTSKNHGKMRQQYNRHHGTKAKEFKIGDAVYVRDFRIPSKPRWTSGHIVRRQGRSLFRVRTESDKFWTRHANQLRHRHIEAAADHLLEEFDIVPARRTPSSTLADTSTELPSTLDRSLRSSSEADDDDAPSMPRRSTRIRRSPQRLQVRPHLPSYD